MVVEGSQSTRREPVEKERSQEVNQGPFCYEATVQTTVPPCRLYLGIFRLNIDHMIPPISPLSSLFCRLPYAGYFGGVSGLSKKQFLKINGFPNEYWGWGGEDDDIYNR